MLRPYQEETVKKMLWGMTLTGNGIISLPTGSGKTHVIAEFTKRLGKPILILVPSKELLEQDLEKLSQAVNPQDIGVFSASMNSKEVKMYTLATIQSAYRHPELFTHYDIAIIDECDLVNPKNLDGMYNTFFKQIGIKHVFGLTATPFRMDSFYRNVGGGFQFRGYNNMETVHTLKMLTRFKQKFWHRVLHVVHSEDLIREGFLCPLTYHNVSILDQTRFSFNKSKTEFDLEDFEKQFNPFLNKTAELVADTDGSCLVFCATLGQAENLKALIKGSEIVSGETPKKKREQMIAEFRADKIRVMINVGVLLVGFDKPDLVNIVIARPTRSLRLHSQLLGRGMRIAPNKETCHIFDLVGNVKSLGTAESMKIQKIDNLWNVTTDAHPDGLHYKELFTFKLSNRPKPSEE